VHLQALLADIDVERVDGDPAVDVTSLAYDSRRVTPGSLFACVPGEHTDGHDHAADAVAAGSVALLVERPLRLGVTEVGVPSTRAAIGPIAARFYDEPSAALRCLGVTGTNGKTTVCHFLEAIAEAAGERTGLIGTTGARIAGLELPLAHTTPEATDLQTLLATMRDAAVTTVAMEVSSHALAQHRVDGTRFAAACFTNLSHDHLDFHGDEPTYFEAKARLFTDGFTKAAAVNVDDEHGRVVAGRAAAAGLDVIECSLTREGAAVHARDLQLTDAGATFVLVDERAGAEATVRTVLVGRHNVANALAAAATARAAALPFDAVVAGLGAVARVPGRLEAVDAGQDFAVFVDYAHTPDALASAIEAARGVAGTGRVLVVFGCGGDRDPAKRPLMGKVAASSADVAIITSDNPRSERAADIADEMLAGVAEGAKVTIELDRRVAIRGALDAATTGDVVLIAGKGHETGQTSGDITVPFDDRAVARELLEETSCS
jgi:UDP-N-acetylmuramoyl-L-alanyl-D-glutamate--2,6-diaminopimelate ligase